MRKTKALSVVLLVGIVLSVPWGMGADAKAEKGSSDQTNTATSESKPASQPTKPEDEVLSPLENRLMNILVAASMKMEQAKEKARKLQPKVEVAIEKAKNSECGQKITELTRTAKAKAREMAAEAKKTARAAGTQLEKAAEQTADKAERMDTAVSSAKKDACKIKPQTPASQPTDAYFKALWCYRLLRAKQSLLKARAVCEQTVAAALKGADATEKTDGVNQCQRAPPRKEVLDMK